MRTHSAPTILLLLLLLCSACSLAFPADDLVKTVFDAIEKEVKFFGEDYSSINVDGVFGIRLGEGQIKAAISECEERSCDPATLARLLDIEKELTVICDSSLPYLKAADEAYFQRFEATINKPYILPYTPTSFKSDKVTIGDDGQYNEDAGDECYGRMMGTFIEQDKTLPKCNITSGCMKMMSRDKTVKYFITHQLLYFIIVEHVGCKENMEKFMKDSNTNLYEIQSKFCRKIYEEAKQLEEKGHVRPQWRDLFLEQTLLCGTLGFEDFLRPNWVKMVLGWQDKMDGCFKYDMMAELASYERNSRRQLLGGNGSTMRKLLREKQMKGGCMSHTSGLGFGVLSTYLRYLLRTV